MAEGMTRKPYRRDVPPFRWFLHQPRYIRYMLREFSCLFIGGWTLLLVCGLKSLSEGREAYDALLARLGSPASVVFLVIALGFALYHSITWFNLTPKALPVQVGEDFLPDGVIAGAHFAAWGLLSVIVLVLAGAF